MKKLADSKVGLMLSAMFEIQFTDEAYTNYLKPLVS